MTRRVLEQWNSLDGCLPCLLKASHTRCGSQWMCQYPAPSQVHKVSGAGQAICLGGLSAPLPGTDHRHHCVVRPKHRSETCFDAADHRIVGFPKLILQTVHMEVINAGEAPELLP